jgi:hypothetical protein
MYFSAAAGGFDGHHCVGVALSQDIEGPFTPLDQPLLCPDPSGNGTPMNPAPLIPSSGQGGAIDASPFRDVDGSLYVVYKIDGNSLGGGGTCGNGNGQFATPIMMAPVADDGFSPRENPFVILDRGPADGPLIEAPSLYRSPEGYYNLFFSSNCWNTDLYDVTWSTAMNVRGPYSKYGPLFRTGDYGLNGPGGAGAASDGVHVAFHANIANGRGMFITTLAGDGSNVHVA